MPEVVEAGDDDFESGDDADLAFEADDDEIVSVRCPYCRKPIWEEAIACEHCGNYLSREDRPWLKPWWLVAGVIVGLLCVLFWILRA